MDNIRVRSCCDEKIRNKQYSTYIYIYVHFVPSVSDPDPLHLAGSGATSMPAPDPDPGLLRFIFADPDRLK